MRQRTFPEIAALVLMGLSGLSFVLIIQTYNQRLFQVGLLILIVATLLEIAVGNIPTDATVARSLLLVVLIMALVAGVVGLSIALVPWLTGLGR